MQRKNIKELAVVPAVEGSEIMKKSKKQKAALVEGLGDTLERINKACNARELSDGSRRSAVSMANTQFKKYRLLMTTEEIEKDSPNAKAKGNNKWLLKLVSQ
jgi:hypothetical protein